MKKPIIIILSVLLVIGCSTPSAASQETSTAVSNNTDSLQISSQISQPISSAASNETSLLSSSAPSETCCAESEPVLTGIDLYMHCFNEGKYDIYNLKIGDPIQNAIDEFGQGKKGYYGLGGTCYTYKEVVIVFAEGTESFTNKVEIFDIIGKGITAYGITTGKSTIEDVKKILGEPEYTKQYTYEMVKTMEDPYDAGERYCNLCYYNSNMDLWCYINFFFEDGVLKVISLGTLTGFYDNN